MFLVAVALLGRIEEVVDEMLGCLIAVDVGIELGKELFDIFDNSDMILVLLDTAVKPSRDLYILFNAT